MRHLTFSDRIINEIDHALRTVTGPPGSGQRPNPGAAMSEVELSASALDLPAPIKGLVRLMAKMMNRITYWI